MRGKELKGRVAIVSGSCGDGMGRSTALTLAREGADVVLNYGTFRKNAQTARIVAKAISKFGVNVLIIPGNMTKSEDVKRLVEKTVIKFGKLDIFVVNSGGGWKETEFADIDVKYWEWMMDAEINSAFFAMKYALPVMRKNKWGRIILMGMMGAMNWTGEPYDAPIGKASRIHLMRELASLEIKKGITINTICPGYIPHFSFDKAMNAVMGGKIFRNRKNGNPQDAAEVIAFLCSEVARFISGRTINIYG